MPLEVEPGHLSAPPSVLTIPGSDLVALGLGAPTVVVVLTPDEAKRLAGQLLHAIGYGAGRRPLPSPQAASPSPPGPSTRTPR